MAVTVVAMIGSSALDAAIKLPAFFSDHMVLQRDTQAAIWAQCPPNTTITLSPSWNRKVYRTTASASDDWKLTVDTPAAGGPHQIDNADGTSLRLRRHNL